MRTANGSAAAVAAIVLIAIALAVEVVRLSTVPSFAETRPALASRFAPDVPDSLAGAAMTEVGKAALQGTDPDQAAMARLQMLAAIAPLRPEPFLVDAALAQRRGDYGVARKLLGEALWRDPRSVAAHYLLADLSFRERDLRNGLREVAILSRLVPAISVQLIPAFSQYARAPGAQEAFRSMLKQNPRLKLPLLSALSADPDQAGLVLALAGNDARLADPGSQAWKRRLLDGFIARGEYERAYDLWRGFAGLPGTSRPLLFNADFRKLAAPEPFNWSFSSSAAGVAEPRMGRLEVIYYGRQDSLLAAQLLLLRPGTYRFRAPFAGNVAASSLAWSVRCIDQKAEIMHANLARPGDIAAEVIVPESDCGAQWLELKGIAQDMPQESDVQIGPVQIESIRG